MACCCFGASGDMGNNLQYWRPTHISEVWTNRRRQWLTPTIVRPGRCLGLCNLQVRSVQQRRLWLYMGCLNDAMSSDTACIAMEALAT